MAWFFWFMTFLFTCSAACGWSYLDFNERKLNENQAAKWFVSSLVSTIAAIFSLITAIVIAAN